MPGVGWVFYLRIRLNIVCILFLHHGKFTFGTQSHGGLVQMDFPFQLGRFFSCFFEKGIGIPNAWLPMGPKGKPFRGKKMGGWHSGCGPLNSHRLNFKEDVELLRVVAAAAQRRFFSFLFFFLEGPWSGDVDSVPPKRVVGIASGSEKRLGLCVMYIKINTKNG